MFSPRSRIQGMPVRGASLSREPHGGPANTTGTNAEKTRQAVSSSASNPDQEPVPPAPPHRGKNMVGANEMASAPARHSCSPRRMWSANTMNTNHAQPTANSAQAITLNHPAHSSASSACCSERDTGTWHGRVCCDRCAASESHDSGKAAAQSRTPDKQERPDTGARAARARTRNPQPRKPRPIPAAANPAETRTRPGLPADSSAPANESGRPPPRP